MESDKTVGGCKIGNFLSIRGLTIVPCVNPDGTEIALHGSEAAFKYKPLVEKVCTDTYKWQANARGVDINHNFNAGWCRLKQLELKTISSVLRRQDSAAIIPKANPKLKL